MSYLAEVIIKELKLVFTNKYYLFLICLWPFIDFIFLGGIYYYGNVQNWFDGKSTDVGVDKDHSKISRTISRFFDTSYAFDVKYKLDDVEDFRYLLTRNKIYMGIYIPKDTQKNIKKSLPAEVSFYIDGSNYLTANLSEIEGANILGTINAGLKYEEFFTKKRHYLIKKQK